MKAGEGFLYPVLGTRVYEHSQFVTYTCVRVCVSYVYVCVQSTRGTVQRKSSCPAGSRWDGMASCLYQFATDPLALDKLITLQRRSFLLEKTGTCFLSLPDAVRSNQPAV